MAIIAVPQAQIAKDKAYLTFKLDGNCLKLNVTDAELRVYYHAQS
jgi:hypothetical protein